RANRRLDAREHVRSAFEAFRGVGAHAFAHRARRELVATGESVRTRSYDQRDPLTAQEAHIARLASEGATNPEIGSQLFVSPRTSSTTSSRCSPSSGSTPAGSSAAHS